ncbi:MAG: hypothetical protein U5M23_14110 [Marinagarivorans sp.]|nr:hypothetical protein [Marinagarivorans sp.]
MTDHSIYDQDAVISAEKAYIEKNRTRAGIDGDNYCGLAISGGGIRSSSFALGVIQALVRANILKKMDYLSTSSGGGYLGASLTWFLRQGLDNGDAAGVDPKNFPLGAPNKPLTDPQNTALDYIRQHGNYLAPSKSLSPISLIAVIMRTSLVSLLAYFTLLSTLMLILMKAYIFDPVTLFEPWLKYPPSGFLHWVLANYFCFFAAIFIVLFIVRCLWFALFAGISFASDLRSYPERTTAQKRLGMLLSAFIGCLLVGTIPLLHEWLDNFIKSQHMQAGGLSAALGSVVGFIQYVRTRRGNGGGIISGAGIFIAAFLILYGLGYAAYAFNVIAEDHEQARWFFLAGGISAFILNFFVNVNFLGLHAMYRDRLMEVFLPGKDAVKNNQWGLANDADKALLEDMCQQPNERPYHLINTNVVLSDSDISRFCSRGGDSFLLSPLFCGSGATGWAKTSEWLKPDPKKDKNNKTAGMTLASAMAISGASVNPNAGNSGRGANRTKLVSTLLTLLNVRLGYWVTHPKYSHSRWFKPNFINPSLWGTFLGSGLHERRKVLELTDGGHFDNLGIYELIRRKASLIIVADGGADPTFSFDDLGNAVEKVRVDFGVNIRFYDEHYNLANLQPNSYGKELVGQERFGFAKHSFAVASIRYPDGTTGRLIYLKATMIENLPADVYNYRASHPSFPHEPTADQFFNEIQIEAYRELGYQLTWNMLEKNGTTIDEKIWEPAKNLDALKDKKS